MALMCFHAARSSSRLTGNGDLVLLPDQDRGLWDARLIAEGCAWLDRSAAGESMTAYHLEAAIAFEHCRAPSATAWNRILPYYQWQCRIAPGPMADLNRIAVVLKAEGAAEALKELEGVARPEGLGSLPLYHALLGEIHMGLGNREQARAGYEAAANLTQAEAVRKVLREKARQACPAGDDPAEQPEMAGPGPP